MTDATPYPETDVPDDEQPAGRCPYCDRPFANERLVWLHVDEAHDVDPSPDEREAIAVARAAESDELFFYQLRVTIALGVTYSVTALSLMFFLG